MSTPAPVVVPQMPIPATSTLPYLIAIVIMTLAGVIGVVAVVVLRPNQDNAALFVAIAGFVGPTSAALMAFLKTQETHLLVNSRMDEFKSLLAANAAAAEELARIKGYGQGAAEHPKKETS